MLGLVEARGMPQECLNLESSRAGSLAGSSPSWADVVGRDGIEPPTLRFSAGCGTSRSVRHGSPEAGDGDLGLGLVVMAPARIQCGPGGLSSQ